MLFFLLLLQKNLPLSLLAHFHCLRLQLLHLKQPAMLP
jgi:hypothetical protein